MSLYDELGGQPAVEAALDRFYARVMDDPVLTPFFEGIDIHTLKGKQRAFLTMAFGGPNEYQGADLRSAHAQPRARGLDVEGFDRFMGHFRSTLEELDVSEDHIVTVMSIAYGGQDDVLDV